MKYTRKLLLILLLGVAVWGINWRRLHPPPSALDLQVRALLQTADSVDAKVESVQPGYGSIMIFTTKLSLSETRLVVDLLNLNLQKPQMWGSGYVPIVYVNFYRKGKWLGSLSSGYGVSGWNYYASSNGLHPTTIRRLRTLIARHPELMRAVVKAGADPDYLTPSRYAANDR